MNNKVAVVLSIIWTIFILPVQCILTGHFVLKEKRSLCEHNFNSDSGEFTSSNYPDKYPSNQDCYYYITVKSGLFVKLEFTRFDIEEILDYVEIYDGSSTTGRHIGTYSGSTLPPVIISSTPSISLYFHSDDLLERLGFRVTYKAVNTSNEGECGGTYYSDYGVITSPNYPMPYPNNAACYYFITMLNETSLVQLKFTYFSTEFGLDYVSVIDGSTKSGYQLGRYFGQYPSGILAPLSSGPSIIVYFYSDDAVQHFGFSATFRSTKVEVEEPVECDGTFTSAWDIVRSPNFPDVYLNSQLQFTTMDTEETYDVIEILDGDCSSENIGIYSGYALLPVIASSGPSMCLNFHTDSSTVRGGFEAFYTITPLDGINVCDYNASTGLGGVIYLAYPGENPSPILCHLNISSLFRYDMVYLKFIDIDVYDGGTQNCYDGDSLVVSSADGQNITFCDGANYETEVKMTSRSAIDILFLSDDVMTSSSRGFKAIYSLYYQVETHESCIDDNDVRCSDGRCISLSVWLVDGYDFCGFDTPHEKGFPAFALVGPIVGMLVFFFCSLLASHIKGKCKSTNNEASNQAAVSLQSLNGTTTGEILESAISDNHESTSATVNSDNNDDDGNENEDSSLQSASLGRRNFDFSHSEEMAPPLNDTNQFRSNSPNHRKSILDTPPSYVNVVKIAAPRTVFNYDDDFEDSQSQSSEADNSSIEEQILPPTAPPLENDTCSSTRTDEPPPPSYDDVLRTTDHYLTL